MVDVAIEHYELERRLGAGAFATVWLAHDPILDGKVAIKVLAENWAFDEEVKSRFLEEARLMYRASDPHFVRVMRAGEIENGQPYLVMEYADRGTLADRLHDPAIQLSVDEAVDLIGAVADCARAVHAHGFIHRDIKPSNVLIASTIDERSEPTPPLAADERLLLADFGLAKDVAAASGFTRASGSPVYMAPEQGRTNHQLDRRVDIHALGVTAFEILTGVAPLDASIEPTFELPAVSSIHPHLAAFDDVITRATKTSPADRHADVDSFMAEVRGVLDEVAAPRETAAPGRSKRTLIGAVVGGAVVLGVAAGLIWRAQATDDGAESAQSAESAEAVTASDDESTDPTTSGEAGELTGESSTTVEAEPTIVPVDTSGIEDMCEFTERPAGSLTDQPGPVYCTLTAPDGDLSTAQSGENYWIDEFDHLATEAQFSTAAYLLFAFGGPRSRFWLTDDHLLADIESDGVAGTALIRPVRPFFFEEDRFVVEMATVAGSTAITGDQYALAEFVVVADGESTVLSASDRASRAILGQHTISCVVDPRRIFSCELVGDGDRNDLDQGRIWRISPTGAEGDGITDEVVVGDLAADLRCRATDTVQDCTNNYRVEIAPTSIRVEVNGSLLFEQTGLPELPAELVDGELLVFFGAYNSGIESESVRVTWDRLAINPDGAALTRIGSDS